MGKIKREKVVYIFVNGRFSNQPWGEQHSKEWGSKGSLSHEVVVVMEWRWTCFGHHVCLTWSALRLLYSQFGFHTMAEQVCRSKSSCLEFCLRGIQSWRQVTIYLWSCSLNIIYNNKHGNNLNIQQQDNVYKSYTMLIGWNVMQLLKMTAIWKVWQFSRILNVPILQPNNSTSVNLYQVKNVR